MIITSHATLGIAIASVYPNPLVYSSVGFVSHFLLDMIPHSHLKDDSRLLNVQVVFDVLVAFGMVCGLYYLTDNLAFVWGAVTASIMDLDAVFYHPGLGRIGKYTRKIFPDWISKVHGKYQNETNKYYGIITQIFVILVSLYIVDSQFVK